MSDRQHSRVLRELAMEGAPIRDEKRQNTGCLIGIHHPASEATDIVCIVHMDSDPPDIYRSQREEFLEFLDPDEPIENKFSLYSSMDGWEDAQEDIEKRLLNFESLDGKGVRREWRQIGKDWRQYGADDTASRDAMYDFLREHGLTGKHESLD